MLPFETEGRWLLLILVADVMKPYMYLLCSSPVSFFAMLRMNDVPRTINQLAMLIVSNSIVMISVVIATKNITTYFAQCDS